MSMHLRHIAFGALLSIASPAFAQVIEIDPEGQATVYDGAAIFTADGIAPIDQQYRTATPASAAGTQFAAVAREHGLEPGLLEAVAWQESRGRMDAVSPKGALGIMQLMPGTAATLGVDPRDPEQNIRGGALYLRQQIDRFGSVPLALAAYNAGPGAVRRFRGIPPFRETRAYVAAIMARWRPAMQTDTVIPLIMEVPKL